MPFAVAQDRRGTPAARARRGSGRRSAIQATLTSAYASTIAMRLMRPPGLVWLSSLTIPVPYRRADPESTAGAADTLGHSRPRDGRSAPPRPWGKRSAGRPGATGPAPGGGPTCRACRREHGLGRREAGHRHAERRAGHVVEADPLALVDRRRVAAVLAADADLEVRARRAALVHGHLHLVGDHVVQGLERVLREDPVLDVLEEEAALGVVAAVAERHLGQVVGAEAEELGVLGDLVRDPARRAGSRSWCRT